MQYFYIVVVVLLPLSTSSREKLTGSHLCCKVFHCRSLINQIKYGIRQDLFEFFSATLIDFRSILLIWMLHTHLVKVI